MSRLHTYEIPWNIININYNYRVNQKSDKYMSWRVENVGPLVEKVKIKFLMVDNAYSLQSRRAMGPKYWPDVSKSEIMPQSRHRTGTNVNQLLSLPFMFRSNLLPVCSSCRPTRLFSLWSHLDRRSIRYGPCISIACFDRSFYHRLSIYHPAGALEHHGCFGLPAWILKCKIEVDELVMLRWLG